MEKTLLKNIVINFAGLIAPTLVSLATVPAYIHLLGVERYGVINLVWALIGYFSLLDLGTSLATENQIAKVRDAGDDSVERIFWGACFLNLATGIVGGVLVYFGAYFYMAYGVHIEPAFQREVMAALPWIAIAVPLANVTWVFAGAITAVERFASYNTNQTLGTMLFQLLPLAAIYCFSASLAVVIPAAVCARLIAGVMLGVATFRALGIKRVRKPERKVIGELFGYGKWMLLFSGAGAIAGSLDRVLVGAILGARFVTYYATPQNLVQRLNMLPSAMLRSLFPRLSAASRNEVDALARDSLAFLNGAFTPCMIVALFALGPFLTLWLGAPLAAASAPVGRVLVLGVWLAGQSGILGILIQAQANPAYVARVSWLQLPVFVAALWFATHAFGVVGAGAIVVAKALFDYGAYLYFARVHVRVILGNMLAHLAFLLAALMLAANLSGLPLIVAAGLALAGANLGWSLYRSRALRELLHKLWTRVSLQAN
ncbi:MAG: oligosaccharide flippase family protein [Pseudomonadota bacterium]